MKVRTVVFIRLYLTPPTPNIRQVVHGRSQCRAPGGSQERVSYFGIERLTSRDRDIYYPGFAKPYSNAILISVRRPPCSLSANADAPCS